MKVCPGPTDYYFLRKLVPVRLCDPTWVWCGLVGSPLYQVCNAILNVALSLHPLSALWHTHHPVTTVNLIYKVCILPVILILPQGNAKRSFAGARTVAVEKTFAKRPPSLVFCEQALPHAAAGHISPTTDGNAHHHDPT